MTRWLLERLTLSFAVVVGLGILFAFRTMGSIIVVYMDNLGVESLDAEGKTAIILLIVILIGSVKVFSNRK